jgi:hypothetical protein
MNALVEKRTLSPAKTAEASMHIARLFATMMSPKGEEFTKVVAADYIAAVKGIPEWAIAETSEAYRFGRIGDGRFVPTPGEFAKHARSLFEDEARRAQDRRIRAKQAEEVRERQRMLQQRTPEQKARVQAAVERFKAKYEAERENDYDSPERVALRADMMARHDARFMAKEEAG